MKIIKNKKKWKRKVADLIKKYFLFRRYSSAIYVFLQIFFQNFAFCDDVTWQLLFIEHDFLLLLLGFTSIPNLKH